MGRQTWIGATVVVASLMSTAQTHAQPAVGPGGHSYEAILADGIAWDPADIAASAMNLDTVCGDVLGHLATVTSATEDGFVHGLWAIANPNPAGIFADSEAWIGGFQPAGSPEPLGGWTWINGEGLLGPPGYENWLPGEPNDVGGGEGHLAIALRGLVGWNDEGHLGGIAGYIVEYDCNLVDIDIKPGSDPNCLNVNGHGVIPVAINGSENFDATTVDFDTLEFGGLSVNVVGKDRLQCSIQDWNADGFDDVVCQFEDDATAWDPEDGQACLSGDTFDGEAIGGCDSICLRPPE